MTILGIDYGRRRLGLAVADGSLAEPYLAIKISSQKELVEKLSLICEDLTIQQIVVGLPEGVMAVETKSFAKKLEAKTGLKTVFIDETLSTNEAEKRLILSGRRQKKRKKLIDAAAAAVILQRYLDEINIKY